MLNEPELRSPSYRPDFPVNLNDGQVWHLPLPIIRVVPVRGEDGKPKSKESSSLGADYIDRVHAYQKAISDWQESSEDDAEASKTYLACQLDLFIALLQSNYTLDYEQAADLIAIDLRDDSQAGQLRKVASLACGVPPKLLAVGSSQVSEPTA